MKSGVNPVHARVWEAGIQACVIPAQAGISALKFCNYNLKYLGLILIITSRAVFADMSALANESIVVTNNPQIDRQINKPTIAPSVNHLYVAPSLAAATIPVGTTAMPTVPTSQDKPESQPNHAPVVSNGLDISTSSKLETVTTKEAIPVNTKQAKQKSKRQKYAKHRASPLAALTFDFSYSGDISGVPLQLRNYDSHLSILHALGTKKPLNIGISLQGANLEDIIDAIASQTNDQVHLIFNAEDDSVRLNYIGVMDVGDDAVSESLKWQQGGAPRPILKQDGVVRFPYGEYQPVVTCQPLNLCDVELQAGEDIQGIVIGDSQRWNEGDNGIPIVYSGVAGNLFPHLVLKPSQGGLDTTLMITTSRRTYMLRLKSSFSAYVARVGFYYPAEMIQKFNDNKAKLKTGNNATTMEQTGALNPDMKMPLINLSKVNYAYTISGDDYVWKPTQVFDDGVSVYIQLPDSVSSRSLPGICILVDGDEKGGRCEMVNFRYNDHFYIVDKLFNQARLINGYDDRMQIITIKRKPDKPGFWARLFGSQ